MKAFKLNLTQSAVITTLVLLLSILTLPCFSSLPIQNDFTVLQSPSCRAFISNLDGFSVISLHGYYVKGFLVISPESGDVVYCIPISVKEYPYLKATLILYHANLKGEKYLLIEAPSAVEGTRDCFINVSIFYTSVSASYSINDNGTVTISGIVSAGGYVIFNAVVNIILENGSIYSTLSDYGGCFSLVVPFSAKYIIKVHGGYIPEVQYAIICSSIEIIKVSLP